MKNKVLILSLLLCCFFLSASSATLKDRWKIQLDGTIVWSVSKGDAHSDHVEMSGKYISVVLRYGVEKNGSFVLNKSLNFPMLRTVPNNTHATLDRRLSWNPLNLLEANGAGLTEEQVNSLSMKGMLNVKSIAKFGRNEFGVSRTMFPSIDKPAFIETFDITNLSDNDVTLEVPQYRSAIETDSKRGVDNHVYCIVSTLNKSGVFHLKKGEVLHLSAVNVGYKKGESEVTLDADAELSKRAALVDKWMNNLVFDSPDSIINTMFAFSKIRACESIYQTKCGPMHGPGGESYYAAVWANDQAEYINPYFPYTGYAYGNASALNSYQLFARYMNKEWTPIPSSIIAEGQDIWHGAGDRGDAAMIAYGASRYVLARGDKSEAEQLWPLIKWCLEYCRRKLNNDGVVTSNSDELEGRFPAGKANLNTSCLYYDALLSAAYLNDALGGDKSISSSYRSQAQQMRTNIDKYFAHQMDGFDTYTYYKGNDKLRAWICTPLVMGITERAKGTLQALYSSHLWSDNGLLSQEGSETYWDRSTLYALRGSFYVGETEKALNFLKFYSEKRLLGEHVPYAIEAWPEGSQRHLSAESGLYGRIITEGIFGIRPIGFRQFFFTPRLPKEWNRMALRKIGAFQSNFDIEVQRTSKDKLKVVISKLGKTVMKKNVKEGEAIKVQL